jgi:hypothetical protein
MPGMVRASLGCYTTREDLDVFVDMLERVARGEYRGTYVQERATGAFRAEAYNVDFARYCSIAGNKPMERIPSESS